MEQKEKIKALVIELLNTSHEAMINKIERAINCGAIDIESWDENNSPMIIPKIIATAILERESTQWSAKGTSFEKKIKREVKNLRYYI